MTDNLTIENANAQERATAALIEYIAYNKRPRKGEYVRDWLLEAAPIMVDIVLKEASYPQPVALSDKEIMQEAKKWYDEYAPNDDRLISGRLALACEAFFAASRLLPHLRNAPVEKPSGVGEWAGLSDDESKLAVEAFYDSHPGVNGVPEAIDEMLSKLASEGIITRALTKATAPAEAGHGGRGIPPKALHINITNFINRWSIVPHADHPKSLDMISDFMLCLGSEAALNTTQAPTVGG